MTEQSIIDIGFWFSGFITGYGVCGGVIHRKLKKNQDKIVSNAIQEIENKLLERAAKESYNTKA